MNEFAVGMSGGVVVAAVSVARRRERRVATGLWVGGLLLPLGFVAYVLSLFLATYLYVDVGREPFSLAAAGAGLAAGFGAALLGPVLATRRGWGRPGLSWRGVPPALLGGAVGIGLGYVWGSALDNPEEILSPDAILAFLGCWWAGTALGVLAARRRRRPAAIAAAGVVALSPLVWLLAVVLPEYAYAVPMLAGSAVAGAVAYQA